MDSTVAPPAPPTPPARRRLALGGLFLAFAAYAFLLALYVGAYAGGSDSSGYLNNAKLLRQGRVKVEQRAIPGLPPEKLPSYAYVPLGFMPVGRREMVPTYPVGLSLFFVALSPLTGAEAAPNVTVWLHALAGVALMFALARAAGLPVSGAALGALLLGASPLYLFISLQALSDVPALVWSTAAVLCAWHGRRKNRWALAAGAAVAVAVLMRPSDLLILLPVALCLGFNWRRWAWLGLGGAPGAVFLGLFNFALYGNPLSTGYGPVEQIFSWAYAPLSLASYATWLPVLLTPAAILVVALPWLAWRGPRLFVAVLAVWMAGFAGFYAFYFHTHENWSYLRFLLPAFPAGLVAILLAGQAMAARWSIRIAGITAAFAAMAVLAWDGFWTHRLSVLGISEGEYKYVQVARWAQAHLPENAVIAVMQTSGSMFYYTPFTLVRYEQFGAEQFPLIEHAAAAAGRPIYAALFQEDIKRALQDQMPGQWTQIGAVKEATFWRLDGPVAAPVTAAPWHEFFSTKTGGTEVTAQNIEGWFDVEHSLFHTWTWSSGRGRLELETWPRETRTATFEFALRSLAPCTVTVSQDGAVLWQGVSGTRRTPVTFTFPVRAGHARLEFATDLPGRPESTSPDARLLAFAVYDPKLTLAGDAK